MCLVKAVMEGRGLIGVRKSRRSRQGLVGRGQAGSGMVSLGGQGKVVFGRARRSTASRVLAGQPKAVLVS